VAIEPGFSGFCIDFAVNGDAVVFQFFEPSPRFPGL